ncbi:Phosphinothricin N-acetyltransferase [Lachnospiraceae bacterium TWA4]|nr:Phosphinothricin N-acetyltransferase [Lachnospiraceae bacterium TWA4]
MIRDATIKDVPRLLEIYSYYVTDTAITFEYEIPSPAEFERRMKEITTRYPYLVIEEEGKIMGYAYARPFVGRKAYDWSCELTIYLDYQAKKRGYGRKLYERLELELKNMGILNLYSCIGYPQVEDEYLDNNSVNFHEHLGFKIVGTFYKCGYKFGRWYHMVWMEKLIGEHKERQEDIKNYKGE